MRLGTIVLAVYTLFSGGKSDYTIVVDSDGSASQKYAATELQTWIEKVSGATIPIVEATGTDPASPSSHRIFVGYGAGVRDLLPGEPEPEANDETTHVRSINGDIMIWGGSTRGTLYAVYGFLERELGCNWFTSTVYSAPHRNSWRFTSPDFTSSGGTTADNRPANSVPPSSIDHSEAPGIAVRNNFTHDAFDPVWAARTRCNGHSRRHNDRTDPLGGGESFWGGHSLGEFIPVGEFFETHPEYFGLKDGRRNVYQRCLSNPDVLRIVTERLRQKMRKDPRHLIYSVGQNDGYNPCECAECQAIKDKFGGRESGIMIWFVNQVADAIRDEFPDKYVGTFAYVYTRQAPQNIRPADNVVVRLCSIEECQIHGYDECDRNIDFANDLKEWAAISKHLYIWDYVTTFTQYVAPMPNFWTFQNRMQTYRDCNALGVMAQGDYSSAGGAGDPIRNWMLAKLMWNPDADADSLLNVFLQGYYGRAAGQMRRFLDFERRMLVREDQHPDCYPDHFNGIYSDEYITEGRRMLQRARHSVRRDSALVARIELAEMPLCYLQILRHQNDGIDPEALDLFKRVCRRERVTRLCECSNGFPSAMDFCNAMETNAYLTLDQDMYGNLTFYHPDTPNVSFKRFSEGATRPAGLEDALFLTYFMDCADGTYNTELCLPEKVGGNGRGSYPYQGVIQPGVEYGAESVLGWKRSKYTLQGFQAGSKYVMAITSLSPEKLTFKFVEIPTEQVQPYREDQGRRK